MNRRVRSAPRPAAAQPDRQLSPWLEPPTHGLVASQARIHSTLGVTTCSKIGSNGPSVLRCQASTARCGPRSGPSPLAVSATSATTASEEAQEGTWVRATPQNPLPKPGGLRHPKTGRTLRRTNAISWRARRSLQAWLTARSMTPWRSTHSSTTPSSLATTTSTSARTSWQSSSPKASATRASRPT